MRFFAVPLTADAASANCRKPNGHGSRPELPQTGIRQSSSPPKSQLEPAAGRHDATRSSCSTLRRFTSLISSLLLMLTSLPQPLEAREWRNGKAIPLEEYATSRKSPSHPFSRSSISRRVENANLLGFRCHSCRETLNLQSHYSCSSKLLVAMIMQVM